MTELDRTDGRGPAGRHDPRGAARDHRALPAGRGRRCCRCCTWCRASRAGSPRAASRLRRASSASPPPRSAAVATFYTMYKRRPVGDYHVGVCTNTLCAVMGGDAIFDRLKEHLGDRQRRDHRRRQGHPRAHRVQRGLRLRPGDDGQLGVLRQPDPGVGDPAGRRPARRRRGHADPRRRAICTWREAERVLAGFPDDRADEGPAAGPASLVGLQIARSTAGPPARARRRRPPRTAGRQQARHRPGRVRDPHRAVDAEPSARTPRQTEALMADMLTPVLSDNWDAERPGRSTPTSGAAATRRCARRSAWTPDDVIAAGQGLRPARPRRRRLPDRHEVGLHPAGRRQAALPGGQRRRVRAGHLQGHPADDGQPAHAGRGRDHHARYAIRANHAFIYVRGEVLHVVRRLQRAVAGGLPRRPPRQGHPRLRLRPRRRRARRRRRLHLRRGDRAARLARGPPRPAAAAPAVPRRRRPLRQPDGDQQRRVDRRRCRASSRNGAEWFASMGTEKSKGFDALLAVRPRRRSPASTKRRSASPCASCSTSPAACARATS